MMVDIYTYMYVLLSKAVLLNLYAFKNTVVVNTFRLVS